MPILIEKVRVFGFRGLRDLEVTLTPTTVLIGANNTGKTSFLKAMQLAIGMRQFLSPEDFHVGSDTRTERILVDLRIIPIDDASNAKPEFDEIWEELFGVENIRMDQFDNQYIPMRTECTLDTANGTYRSRQSILSEWPDFEVTPPEQGGPRGVIRWHSHSAISEKPFRYNEIPFFFLDAKRDILDDLKLKKSYLGRLLSKIEYSRETVQKIEDKIRELNDEAVKSSKILSSVRNILSELNSALDSEGDGIEITPFTKKLRDLSKGLSIQYADVTDSFPMEYHGMGTRSWSSLLTLKAFVVYLSQLAQDGHLPFWPIIALEEPEAHLHPHAQRKLYSQLKNSPGQVIVSTHSPYIAASAQIQEIRGFSKGRDVKCSAVMMDGLSGEDIRKINRQVIKTRGEIFFSKAVILFEGETEEQALPIMAEGHFGYHPHLMEIDFVGVGGAGNYKPFLRVLQSLEIPRFILSDGEDNVRKKVEKCIKSLRDESGSDLGSENVFFLDSGCDFERYLLDHGYKEQIETAFSLLHYESYLDDFISRRHGTVRSRRKSGDQCESCGQAILERVTRDYTDEDGYLRALYDCMVYQKTKFGPVIAKVIVDDPEKELPPRILDLFRAVRSVLSREEAPIEREGTA